MCIRDRFDASLVRERGLPVRVNAVSPAGVKTAMWTRLPSFQALVAQHGSEEAAFQALEAGPGGGRFAEPEEVARPILLPGSGEAGRITGVGLSVGAARRHDLPLPTDIPPDLWD